jgi:membrane-bound ClpP family serine protease
MGAETVFRRRFGIVGLIYIVIGIIVAIDKGYINVALLKAVLSAILAILLWWLVLLGVNLHIG